MSPGLGRIELSPGEEWIEYGASGARRRLAFHDYASIYAVPGLYERVFYEELGMCTAAVVVGAYTEVLRDGGLPAEECVLDFGAGNGIGGAELRDAGVGHVVALDIEPAARDAALRDRPTAYDDYLVGDLGAEPGLAEDLGGRGLTAVLALSAVGVGHVPPPTLGRALDLLDSGGLYAFAVTRELMPGSADRGGIETGYPDFLADLLVSRSEELRRISYVHRRQSDGADHHAVALVGRMR